MKSQISTLLLCLTVLGVSCIKEQKLEFSELNLITKVDSIVSINIPFADGNKAIASKINTTLETYMVRVLRNGDLDKNKDLSINDAMELFRGEFETFKKDFPDSIQFWEAQIDGEVLYQSTEITSIALTTYINTGGAHGNLTISFLNFNTLTGDRITNDDLLLNKNEFTVIVKTHFENEITATDDLLIDEENFELPANIGYNEDGIILLYNVYEIAPYATGIIEFTIPFENISKYLKYE